MRAGGRFALIMALAGFSRGTVRNVGILSRDEMSADWLGPYRSTDWEV